MAEPIKDFAYWWDVQGEWVEEPNERREGSSGVQFVAAAEPGQASLYIKRQINHCYRSLRHPLGRPTVFREEQAIRAFNQLRVRTPKLIYCDAQKLPDHWRALMVTEELEGFISLDEWYEEHADTEAACTPRLLQDIAQMLVTIHQAGWQHSCCYGKHIFVKTDIDSGQAEVAMLDLEKVRRRWPAPSAALHDLNQLSRHKGQMPPEDWQALLQAYAEYWPAMSQRLDALR